MAIRSALLRSILIAVGLSGTSVALSQEGGYQCTQGGLTRQVKIVFDTPGEAVPCRVVYSKPTEGMVDQVLWSAANEAGYCLFKANEFRNQLEGWGWSCDVPQETTAEVVEEDQEALEEAVDQELVSDESALAPPGELEEAEGE